MSTAIDGITERPAGNTSLPDASQGRPLRVALLTNENTPYRLPLYSALAATPDWQFQVFTCIDREDGRLWDVVKQVDFPTKKSFSLCYSRMRRVSSSEEHSARRQVHVPVGVLSDMLRFRPDVVISDEFGARSLLASVTGKLLGHKLVICSESTPYTERHASRRQKMVRRVLRSRTDAYICNGQQARQFLEDLGARPQDIFEVGQAIDLEPFDNSKAEPSRNSLREQWGISGLCFLYTGYLTVRKGLEQLLQAWIAFCCDEDVDATLVLVGDGEDREYLENMISRAGLKNVKLLGFIQHQRLAEVYAAADVFVLPTLEDCFSLAFVEAMAAGLPVIGSLYGGESELVVEGENGWVADPLSHGDLAAKLHLAWQSQDELPQMGERSRASVSKMGIHQVADRIRQAVGYAMDQSSPPRQRGWKETRMISHSEATTVSPAVPVEPWQPSLKAQVNDFGMRSISHLGGTLSSLLGSRSKNHFGILTYHRVAPHTAGLPAPPFNVTPDRFREHLSGLLRRGFHFVPLRLAIESHASGEPLPPRSVAVTFDDCFESVFTEAWPILEDLQVPATLFLSTAYLDSDQPFPFDTWAEEFANRVPASHYRPIRTEQCREMAASGLVELGTHTHTHADFRQHLQAFVEEMQTSVEIVRSRFGVERPPFAFPFGSVVNGFASRDLTEAARAARVTCTLTTEVKLNDIRTDPFGWGRLNAFAWDTSATLSGKLCGWYDWAPRWKHRLAGALKKRRTPS